MKNINLVIYNGIFDHLLIAKNPRLNNDVVHAIKQTAPIKPQSSGRSLKYCSPINTPLKK